MSNSFNYQVSDLADSLSLISEPPDIRNWFSIYTYDSPQLNTYENCGDSVLRVGDDVEEAVDDDERRKEEVNKLDEPTINQDKSIPGEVDSSRSSKYTNMGQDCDPTKATEVSESLSLPSEPPDIRNWFSSYAYESQNLNTHGNSEDSKQGKQGEEKKLEGTATDKHKLDPDEGDSNSSTKYTNSAQYHTKTNKVLGSLSDSLCFSLEPPHVDRWFSSYIYESPSLDTSIDFTDSGSQGTEYVGARCYGGKNCLGKENNLGDLRTVAERNILTNAKNIISYGLVTCSNFVKDTNSQLQCTDKAIDAVEENRLDYSDLPNKNSREHLLKVKPTKDQNVSFSHVRTRDSDGEDFISRDPLNNSSSVKNEKSLEILSQKNGLPQGPSGNDDKENKGNNFQENGFVSTRKKRSDIRSASSLKRSADVPLVVNKENFPKRKPFSERTNLQHNNGLEITGKWKCPQKRKPNLGPPLKQLRLEQWVNRM